MNVARSSCRSCDHNTSIQTTVVNTVAAADDAFRTPDTSNGKGQNKRDQPHQGHRRKERTQQPARPHTSIQVVRPDCITTRPQPSRSGRRAMCAFRGAFRLAGCNMALGQQPHRRPVSWQGSPSPRCRWIHAHSSPTHPTPTQPPSAAVDVSKNCVISASPFGQRIFRRRHHKTARHRNLCPRPQKCALSWIIRVRWIKRTHQCLFRASIFSGTVSTAVRGAPLMNNECRKRKHDHTGYLPDM